MSTYYTKYFTLYNQLKESIDFETAPSLPLRVNRDTRFEVDGINVGIMIQSYEEGAESMFSPGSILYQKYNPDTYFNIGFDIEESNTQIYKTDYRTLARILAIVVKSTLQWVKENKPEVLTIVPIGGSEKEARKKLHIYSSILQSKESILNNLGYYWDRALFMNKPGIYIAKKV